MTKTNSDSKFPDLTNEEAQDLLEKAMNEGVFSFYDPNYYSGATQGLLITKNGYVITFSTDEEWGPYEESATYQCHVSHDGKGGNVVKCREEWVQLFNAS